MSKTFKNELNPDSAACNSRTFVRRTIYWIITAPDTRSRASRLDELNVVVVPKVEG